LPISEDQILLPSRRAPCRNCLVNTLFVHVGGEWRCNTCGAPGELSNMNVRGEILVRALGTQSALKVIIALNKIGEGSARQISLIAGIQHTSAMRAIRTLYEADLVQRKSLYGAGRQKYAFSLNRRNQLVHKLLAFLQECDAANTTNHLLTGVRP
jgi:predicted transcriptional regulator